jgi:hypothetical protein
MANMSYCRFENTYHDLQDCLEHLNDNNLSNTEKKYRDRLILTCENIINEQEVEEVEEVENESEDEIIESEVVDGKNIERKENFNQVCVWPGTIVGQDKIQDFEKFMLEEFDTRVQYLEEIKTYPDKENGKDVEGTGGRNDVFFAVYKEDTGKFAVPRLKMGIRWIEDVLDKGNYRDKIYPERVFDYKTW